MALTSQSGERGGFASRRSVAVVASALAAMALAAAVAGRGCQVDENTPTGVVQSFADAVRADDRQALYELLGPQTRKALDVAAQRATDLVGGAERFGPLDMIGINQGVEVTAPVQIKLERTGELLLEERGDSLATARKDGQNAAKATVREQRTSYAVVEVISASGERSELTVVDIDGQWRIELTGYSVLP